ncbi:MAG: serine hydrolase [Chloroflexota bacterium]|nr:serine hydrolase [Chloroflexota bacterium]
MRKPPSHDDEQDGAYDYPAPSNPRPRRRYMEPPPQPPERFHSDEFPQVPKIKRASLYIDRQDTLPPVSPPEIDEDEESRPRRPRPGRYTPAQPPTATGKVTVTPQRRASAYMPAAPVQRPRFVPAPRRPQSFMARLNDLSHNKLFLLLTAVVLVILLSLVPLMMNAFSSHATRQVNGSGNQPGPSSVGQAPKNPHELVITPLDTRYPPPAIFATAAYVMDADTGATLYAHNPFMHLPEMSTTKLMTAVVALEHGNPDQPITINSTILHDIGQLAPDGTEFGLEPGATYSLRDLMYAMLLVSGNDAAVAVADGVSGNLDQFVALMNQKARQLGMYDSHFMNPHGLMETGHYSSAHDLAVLGRYSMNIPLILQMTGTRIYHIAKGSGHPERFALNGNQFLWWYPGVDGGKPGWDGGKNFVQVISCVRDHHHLIGVVIHSKDFWTDMRDLLNWGFSDFTWISPYDVDFQHPIPFDDQSNYFARDKKENTIPTSDHGRYYIYTGYSIPVLILTYYDQNGGLPKFGYPRGMPDVSQTPNITQKFDHATIRCDLTTKQCSSG